MSSGNYAEFEKAVALQQQSRENWLRRSRTVQPEKHATQVEMKVRLDEMRNLLKRAGDYGVTAREFTLGMDISVGRVYDTLGRYSKIIGAVADGTLRQQQKVWKYRWLNKMGPKNRPAFQSAPAAHGLTLKAPVTFPSAPALRERWSLTLSLPRVPVAWLMGTGAAIVSFVAGMVAGILVT